MGIRPISFAVAAVAAAVAWQGCARGTGTGDDDDAHGGGGSAGTGGSGGTAGTAGTAGDAGSGGSGGSGDSGGSGGSGGTAGTGGSGGSTPTSCGSGALPFAEGFEAGVPPAGWGHVDGSNSYLQWESTSYESHGGSYAAWHDYDWDDDNDILVTPPFDLSGCAPGTAITLTYFEMNSLPSWYEGHFVEYTTTANPTSTSQFVLLQEMGAGSSSWTQRTIALGALAGQPLVRIGFRYYGYDADNWYVDDVAITVN